MASIVLEVLGNYSLLEKLLCITSDSAGNNGTLCESLEQKLAELGILWDARVILLSSVADGRRAISPALRTSSTWLCKHLSSHSTTTSSVLTSPPSSRKSVPSPKVFARVPSGGRCSRNLAKTSTSTLARFPLLSKSAGILSFICLKPLSTYANQSLVFCSPWPSRKTTTPPLAAMKSPFTNVVK